MDRLDMIEKLRERADISYEEAKEILEAAGGDLLEAVVLLEKQGRIRGMSAPDLNAAGKDNAEQAGTGAHTAAQNKDTKETDKKDKAKKGRRKNAFSDAVHRVIGFLKHTSFHILHNDDEVCVMPSWAFAILMFFFWHTLLPAMLIAMFFNIRYHFEGSEDTRAANDVLEKAGSFAEGVEKGLRKEAEKKEADKAEKDAEDAAAEADKNQDKTQAEDDAENAPETTPENNEAEEKEQNAQEPTPEDKDTGAQEKSDIADEDEKPEDDSPETGNQI